MKRSLTAVASGIALMAGALTAAPAAAELPPYRGVFQVTQWTGVCWPSSPEGSQRPASKSSAPRPTAP